MFPINGCEAVGSPLGGLHLASPRYDVSSEDLDRRRGENLITMLNRIYLEMVSSSPSIILASLADNRLIVAELL